MPSSSTGPAPSSGASRTTKPSTERGAAGALAGRIDLNPEILIRPLAGSRLVEDYQAGLPEALAFYPGSPRTLEAYRAKVAEVDARFDRDRRRRVAELVRAPTPGAAAKLEEVVAGNGLFVTTGQQPGLLSGPLYTIHKVLSAIRLADALERSLHRPVLPLFWIASDDHDWEEANHTFILDRDNDLHRIELAGPEDAPPVSMAKRLLGPEVETTLATFIQALPSTEFASFLLERLRAAYSPGRTVAAAFADLLVELLSGFDVAFIDGGQPALKRAAADLVRVELERAADHEALLTRRTRALEQAGYDAQVPVLGGATNVHYEDDRGRERIFRDDGGYVLRRSGRRVERNELLARLDAEPERFSANVALRPVVESAVLPTVAYVGGPGEISYFGQLGPLFEAHGIGMPVVFPRFGVTLIEAKIRKVLDRFGLEVDDFRQPAHELAARVLRQELPGDVTEAITELRKDLTAGYGRLIDAATGIDPTLKGPLQKARNAGHIQLAEVEKKIVHHLKLQSDLALAQLEKAQANLYPNGQPQERVLNVFQYLVRFGPELLEEVARRMDVELDAAAMAAG